MSCASSCENGLDAIAGRGRKVGVVPLRRGQDRVWKRVVHAAATVRIRCVQSMSQAPDLQYDSTCTSTKGHISTVSVVSLCREYSTMVNQARACEFCAYHDSMTAWPRRIAPLSRSFCASSLVTGPHVLGCGTRLDPGMAFTDSLMTLEAVTDYLVLCVPIIVALARELHLPSQLG